MYPYACNRQAQIYTQTFTPDSLPQWLDKLGAPGIPAPITQDYRDLLKLVRHALDHLESPDVLAHNALLTLPPITTVEELRTRLTDAIHAMAEADTPVQAEAGQVLSHYYLRRREGHDIIAHRLHLSRATYYRRLDHGLATLARHLLR